MHLNEALTTDEILDAKHTFEGVAKQQGVQILHYHCDNGCFADKAFFQDIHKARQTISFYGVGATSPRWDCRKMHS